MFLPCNRFFSRQHKYVLWSNIEKNILRFLNSEGVIDDQSLARIENDFDSMTFESLILQEGSEFDEFVRVSFSRSPLLKNFPIISFLNRVSFEDISISLILKDCNELILKKIDDLQNKLKKLANKYKMLVQIGRTHGVHAEPTSFGCKFVVCWCDIKRLLNELWSQRKYLEVITLDHDGFYDPHLSGKLQSFLAESLDLGEEFGNFNFFPKERYSRYLFTLSSLSGVIHKLAMDLHFMAYEGVEEVKFSNNENELYEKIELAAKTINSYANGFSSLTWSYSESGGFLHERIKFYLYESVKFMFVLIDAFNEFLDGMEVSEENLKKNMDFSKKVIFSQSVMLHILKNGQFTRQEVLEDMKIFFSRVLDDTNILYEELFNSPKYGHLFTKAKLDQIFSPIFHLSYIDNLYKRAFGAENNVSFLEEVGLEEGKFFYVMDMLADRINTEYRDVTSPVTVVSFSGKSLIFLGHLMTRLNFPLKIVTFENINHDLNIGSLVFDKSSFLNSRVLIVDYLAFQESKFFDFIKKLKESVEVKDIKICYLMKMQNLDIIGRKINWFGMEYSGNIDYLENN